MHDFLKSIVSSLFLSLRWLHLRLPITIDASFHRIRYPPRVVRVVVPRRNIDAVFLRFDDYLVVPSSSCCNKMGICINTKIFCFDRIDVSMSRKKGRMRQEASARQDGDQKLMIDLCQRRIILPSKMKKQHR